MQKKYITIATVGMLALIAVLAIGFAVAAPPKNSKEADILYFYDMNEPACVAMQDVIAQLHNDYPIGELDASLNPELLQLYDVEIIPTIVVAGDGERVGAVIGEATYAVAKGRIDEIIGNYLNDVPLPAFETKFFAGQKEGEVLFLDLHYDRGDITFNSLARADGAFSDRIQVPKDPYLGRVLNDAGTVLYTFTFDVPLLEVVEGENEGDPGEFIVESEADFVVTIPNFDGAATIEVLDYNGAPVVLKPIPPGLSKTKIRGNNNDDLVLVVDSGKPPSEALDIVFVAENWGHSPHALQEFTDTVMQDVNALVTDPTFSLYSDILNVYLYYNTKDLGCETVGGWTLIRCDSTKIFEVTSHIPFDELVLYSNRLFRSSASVTRGGAGPTTYCRVSALSYSPKITVHELGHSYGGLMDEYRYNVPSGQPYAPNCALACRDFNFYKRGGHGGGGTCFPVCSYDSLYRMKEFCTMRSVYHPWCPPCEYRLNGLLSEELRNNLVTVNLIELAFDKVQGNNDVLAIDVVVGDNWHRSVQNDFTVVGNLTYPDGSVETLTAMTDLEGAVSWTVDVAEIVDGDSYSFIVTDIQSWGWMYYPELNNETSESITVGDLENVYVGKMWMIRSAWYKQAGGSIIWQPGPLTINLIVYEEDGDWADGVTVSVELELPSGQTKKYTGKTEGGNVYFTYEKAGDVPQGLYTSRVLSLSKRGFEYDPAMNMVDTATFNQL